jgi:serine/threonine protein kinase
VTVRLRNSDPDEHDLIGRERSILERFSNPVIPRVLDVAQAVTGSALVLPLFGERLLLRGAVDTREVAGLGIQLARALHELHAVDVWHGRIIRTEISMRDELLLLDGFAHARCELQRSPIERALVSDRRTLSYLSPEQIRGLAWSGPTDVWALAMILVELAQGFHPTRACQSEFERLQAIHRMALELPIARTALGQVLVRGLVAEPERRPSAFELAEALEAFA